MLPWLEDGLKATAFVAHNHGWRYDSDGTCIEIPADQPGVPIPKRARISSLPVAERYGLVWLFVGDLPVEQRPPIPPLPEFEDPNWRSITGEYTWKAHYTRVVESGLDSSHAPFVHSVFFQICGMRQRSPPMK